MLWLNTIVFNHNIPPQAVDRCCRTDIFESLLLLGSCMSISLGSCTSIPLRLHQCHVTHQGLSWHRGTWWSSTRANAGSCTWGGTTPCISTGSGLTCWRAALRRGTWECWWMTGWPWASSVPWLPRRPMGSWGALGGVWPAGRGRFSFPSTLP